MSAWHFHRSMHIASGGPTAPTPPPRRSRARWPAGVDGLETDVCLTADGELVLLHDPLLSLGTTIDGWAHERTSVEIARAALLDRGGRPDGRAAAFAR